MPPSLARRHLGIFTMLATLTWFTLTHTSRTVDEAHATVRPSPLAVLLTAPEGTQSTLHQVRPGERFGPPLATIEHRAGSPIRARTRPADDAIFVSAGVTRSADFDGVLFRVAAGRSPARLCDSLAHASAPLITQDGRIFVSRGIKGQFRATPGEFRIDTLRIDRVDPFSGALNQVHRFTGYLAHLAGFHPGGGSSGELIVYRVSPRGAELVAIDAANGDVRKLRAAMPPFARDFSIGHRHNRLVYRSRHPTHHKQWTVESIDLRDGAHHTHQVDDNFALAPAAWPSGGILSNPGRRGPSLLESSSQFHAPWSRGVDILSAIDTRAGFVALLHTEQGRMPRAYIYDLRRASAHPLPASPGQRITIAGFVSTREAPRP